MLPRRTLAHPLQFAIAQFAFLGKIKEIAKQSHVSASGARCSVGMNSHHVGRSITR